MVSAEHPLHQQRHGVADLAAIAHLRAGQEATADQGLDLVPEQLDRHDKRAIRPALAPPGPDCWHMTSEAGTFVGTAGER